MDVPVCGLVVFLFEPPRYIIPPWLFLLRAAIYGIGFMAMEYGTGWLLRKPRGVDPGDCKGRTRRD